MATRPVFYALPQFPFYETISTEFEYYPGFAVCQKQKCINSLHQEYKRIYGRRKVMDISSKSTISLGVELSAFYNWLYINAVHSNEEMRKKVLEYDSFSDIEFIPKKSISCQAKSAAIYVGLCKSGIVDQALESFGNFMKIVY